MYFNGLFKKRLSIAQGEQLIINHCKANGFDENAALWKDTTHGKSLFAYHRRSNYRTANNWVAYHPIRSNHKFTIWIDLVSGEITEILRQ